MSVSLDTNSLAQQIKDVTLDAVNTVKEAVIGSSTEAEEKHRIFVGNLSLETTEDELRNLFSKVGEVSGVTIPAKRSIRGKSPATSAIAFIGFSNETDAQKAVETVNGQTFREKEITVAIARPIHENRPRAKFTKQTLKSGQQDNGTATASTNATAGGSTDATTPEKKKSKKKPRSRKSVGDNPQETELAAEDTTVSKSSETPSKAKSTRVPRTPRQRGPPADGVPSETTLFVANLDHKTTDADLKEIFSKYSPTTAHVALRPLPPYMIKKLAEKGEQRLGRGFGFVSFADQSVQQEALKSMDGVKVGEKELAVKVAIDANDKAEAAMANGQVSTAAAA